jgi:GNAT superfamily N-acetyltransferase
VPAHPRRKASRLTGRIFVPGVRELDRVAALWTALSGEHAALDPSWKPRAGSSEALSQLVLRMHRDPETLILLYAVEDEIEGLCIARIDEAPPILEEVRRAEISDLLVRKDSRRQGIGSDLVADAHAWIASRGVRRIEIRVAVDNAEGQGFWRARGFTPHVDVLQKRF